MQSPLFSRWPLYELSFRKLLKFPIFPLKSSQNLHLQNLILFIWFLKILNNKLGLELNVSITRGCVLIARVVTRWRQMLGLPVQCLKAPNRMQSFTPFHATTKYHKVKVRYALRKKLRDYLGIFPIPKTFVNWPSIFLCAKFILKC